MVSEELERMYAAYIDTFAKWKRLSRDTLSLSLSILFSSVKNDRCAASARARLGADSRVLSARGNFRRVRDSLIWFLQRVLLRDESREALECWISRARFTIRKGRLSREYVWKSLLKSCPQMSVPSLFFFDSKEFSVVEEGFRKASRARPCARRQAPARLGPSEEDACCEVAAAAAVSLYEVARWRATWATQLARAWAPATLFSSKKGVTDLCLF